MKPPKLQQGDTIAIVSPSNTIANRKDIFEQACRNFEKSTGLKVVAAPHVLGKHFYSSGTVAERLGDFHWALNNPEVKGIIFSVGGSTAVDIVEGLDYETIRQNPKIIAGISDASTLLNAIHNKTGLITFHGLEFLDFASEDMSYEVASIKKAWFDGELDDYQQNQNWKDFDNTRTSFKGWQSIKLGVAEGKIVGGNFRCFTQLITTEYFPVSFQDSILVMETYKWPKKNIHQALVNLKMWGILEQISGLIIGYCIGSDDTEVEGDEQAMADLVNEVISDYDFPAMWIGEIGHNIENLILPIGAKAKLDATNKSLTILESVVS